MKNFKATETKLSISRADSGDGWVASDDEGSSWFAADTGGLWTLRSRGDLDRQIRGTLDFKISPNRRKATRQLRRELEQRAR